MLTYDQVLRCADVREEHIEHRLEMMLDDEQTTRREADFSRVYRLLVKHVVRSPAGAPPTIAFIDAVFTEHHNASGMSPERSTTIPGREPDHDCTELCRDSARLIHVGQEHLLDRLATWWFLRCQSAGRRVETMIVEQDAEVAQTQITTAGFFPLFIYDELQMIVADVMVKEVAHSQGPPTWVMV